MDRQLLTGGSRLRSAGFDSRAGELELEFADRSLRVYRGVPIEVWRRLLAAPNPGTFFEDRIEEEYAWSSATAPADQAARARLDDLFGAAPDPSPATAPTTVPTTTTPTTPSTPPLSTPTASPVPTARPAPKSGEEGS